MFEQKYFLQMKKFLRNIDKHKNDQNSKNNDKAISKLTTMRGILKDGRCGPECTGDSSVQEADGYDLSNTFTIVLKIVITSFPFETKNPFPREPFSNE